VGVSSLVDLYPVIGTLSLEQGIHVVFRPMGKRRDRLKAASRAGQPVEGAEEVVLEFGRPETFDAAFEGVDRALCCCPLAM
jgi:hypothetical protein